MIKQLLCVAVLFCLIQAETAFVPNGGIPGKLPTGPNCSKYVFSNGDDFKDNLSKQECKEKCENALEDKDWECQGMVFRSANNKCWLYGPECDTFVEVDDDDKKGALYLEYDQTALYCEMTNFGNAKTCNGAYSTGAYGLVGQVATLEECKAYCDQHDDCAYFFRGDNKNCFLYNECSLEDARTPTNNGATYKKGECPVDCDGVAFGNAEVDACEVCGGDGSSCADCTGVPNGSTVVDDCGVCDGNNVYMDDCGECFGDNACFDCMGAPNGGAVEDACGVCGGDDSSCADCAGVPNGSTVVDNCGVCGGLNAYMDECGECFGDGSSCAEEASCCTSWNDACYSTASAENNNHACKDCGYAIEHCDNVCSSGSYKSGDLAHTDACRDCCQGYDHEVAWNCPAPLVDMCDQALANPKDCKGATYEDCQASPLSCITKFKNSDGTFKKCKPIKSLICKNQLTIEDCDALCYCTTKLDANDELKKCKDN